MSDVRHARIDGADRTYGPAIRRRLRDDGVAVVDTIAALPVAALLAMLVVDGTTVRVAMPFRAVTDEDVRTLLDRQLYALVAAVQAAVPRMATGGAIVQVIPDAYLGAWGGVHVAASAAACVAMARSMAIELAPLGIRVNTVAVGPDDPATQVAATVAWLAGHDSAQVAGETILANRGASLRMAQAARR